MTENYFIVCIHIHITFFFIHSSLDKHLGCSHVLAILSNTAVNTETHGCGDISLSSNFPLVEYPEVALMDHIVLYLIF